MLNFLDYYRAKLTDHLRTTDNVLEVVSADTARLNAMQEGDHVYLTVHYLDRHEVVKFTKQSGDLKSGKIPVERDILGHGRKNFPTGSCITVDWNSVQLREFICQQNCRG